MNGLWLRGGADAGEIEAFVSGVRGIFSRIDRLETWQRSVVQDNVGAMGKQTPYVAAREYIAFTLERGLPKAELFRQLCRFFGADPQMSRTGARSD